jgi:hypothetical protein
MEFTILNAMNLNIVVYLDPCRHTLSNYDRVTIDGTLYFLCKVYIKYTAYECFLRPITHKTTYYTAMVHQCVLYGHLKRYVM